MGRQLHFHSLRSLALAASFACGALVLASCGGDVDFCSNPGGEGCPTEVDVDFSIESSATIGALQFDVTHLGRRGEWVAGEDRVDCELLVEAMLAANFVGGRELKVGLISLAGIDSPAAVLRCGFRSDEEPEPSDFAVEVTDASDTSSALLDPVPVVVVSAVRPRGR